MAYDLDEKREIRTDDTTALMMSLVISREFELVEKYLG